MTGRRTDIHVKGLVPVRVESLLDHARRVRLLSVDGDNGEGVRQAKDVALRKAIRGNDCYQFSL
jgi:hypothetical protein